MIRRVCRQNAGKNGNPFAIAAAVTYSSNMVALLDKTCCGTDRQETPVRDGIVVTERCGRGWVTTVYQGSQLDGWAVRSESWAEARESHRIVVRMAEQSL